MRPWAKWCLTHRMSFVVYLVAAICSPLYFLVYIPEGFSDWMRDIRSIKHEADKIKRGMK